MRSKAVISRSYPHLSNFFFTKLGIAQAPSYALVDELRMITERYRNRPIPPDVQEHVSEILADISEVIKNVQNIPPSFASLAQLAVFPVHVSGGGIALRHADEFYTPEMPSKYADKFRGKVALLDLSESVPMIRIRPLLESEIFKDKIRYVDKDVTKKSVAQGKKVLDSEATELYSSRIEYLARYVLLAARRATS